MPVGRVDAKTLKRWLASSEALLVDVREPAEHAAEHIEGAHLLPLAQVTKSALPSCDGKKMVLHCRSGKRSALACEKLLQEDPHIEIYSLDGGVSAWHALGGSVTSLTTPFLPLYQQVQLIIGSMLIMGSILGYVFSPLWFLLTGLIGLGLTVAGFTGFCGLAVLVSKMPWNQKVESNANCCAHP